MKLDEILNLFYNYNNSIGIIYNHVSFSYSFITVTILRSAIQFLLEQQSRIDKIIGIAVTGEDSLDKITHFLGLLYVNKQVMLIEPDMKESDPLLEFLDANIKQLKDTKIASILVSTSGTSGKPKIAIHNLETFLERYRKPKRPYITIQFLPLNHIGGLDVMFSTLINGGTLVIPENRNIDTILKTIEKYKVEVFPTTPSFLNLMLMSGEYINYDLSSLKVIAYGAETMPEATLLELHKVFPNVKLKQTYGSTELGTLKTCSKSSDSLYIKLLDNMKVVDNILYIKSLTPMVGYLGEEAPFDDGWYCTGDLVEQDGEYIKILGRASSLVNVGGNKVSPEQVENTIRSFLGIKDCLVYGEENSLLGSIVVADVEVETELESDVFIKLLREHCMKYLPKYAVPITFNIQKKLEITERFKKKRGKN